MAEKRDYSNIVWPWEGDPNWGPPREGATSDSADENNWQLACGECVMYFPPDIKMGVVHDHWAGHFQTEEYPNMQLHLVWVGLGTPPQPPEGIF